MIRFKISNIIIIGYINIHFKKLTPNEIVNIINDFFGYKIIGYQHDHELNKLHKPINIYLNGKSNFLINHEKKLFGKGDNSFGQIGIINNNDNNIDDWTLIPFFNNKHIELVSKSKSTDHTLIYTKDNKLYGFGNNQKGQVCITVDDELIYNPILIKLPIK